MNRVPAVAGSFYPGQPQQLHETISAYLQDVIPGGKVPKAIIVPHAGYMYSGPVAASAYARLIPAADTIKRVVLIGPSHRVGFIGIALSACQAFTTPLGNIALDGSANAALLKLPFVLQLEQAHQQEHSLEVHLPFLQEVLHDFSLIPLVVGEASAEQISQVLELLWGGEETLLVVSSDLSHYHDYATAQHLDQATSALIEKLDYQHISVEAACGRGPISGLLKLLQKKSLHIKTIDLRNSGDTAGDKRRVVGYGAYVVD
jgi:AmmeMemoRadiSam system protein B